jgi:hypothetical protein
MRYHNLLAPMVGLAMAGVAAAQTPSTSSPSYPQSSPSQTPINPPSTPSSGMAMQDGQRREGPEMAFVKAHLDTVLQGISLSYSQFRRIDSTAVSQLAMAGIGRGMGRDGMGRDGMGRDGMRGNENCQPSSSSTGSNNMPGSTGSNSTCTPNQGGTTGYPSSSGTPNSNYPSSSGTPGSSGYPSSSGTPNDTSRSPRWDNRDSSRAGRDGMGRDGMGRNGMGRDGMGRDSLDSNARQRLMPIIDQVDSAIRPILSTAQQRTFDRNLNNWKRQHTTATN